jgi:hypothetical protein
MILSFLSFLNKFLFFLLSSIITLFLILNGLMILSCYSPLPNINFMLAFLLSLYTFLTS